MANRRIYISDVIKDRHDAFYDFCQKMANRLGVGFYRHGKANKRQNYRQRILNAVKHYDETGNLEFLIDAGNYCLLECIAPSRPDAFFQASDSEGSTVNMSLYRKQEPWHYKHEGD